MGVFADIQEIMAKRLKEDNFLAPLEIITQDKGNIEKEISQAISRIGVSIVIFMAEGDCDHPNAPGPYMDRVSIVVEIAENVLLNRSDNGSNKAAGDVLEHVLMALHQYQPKPELAFAVDRQAFRIVNNPPGATITYHARFTVSFALEKQQEN